MMYKKDSIVLNELGQYTDEFNELHDELFQIGSLITDKLKQWLEERNASCSDVKLAFAELPTLFNLDADSEWIHCVEKAKLD